MAEALDNTHLVGQPEEYFRPDHTHLWARRWGLRRNGPYESYVQAAIAFSTTPNGVFSVKLHWYQFAWLMEQLRSFPSNEEPAEDWDLTARTFPHPRYVFLTRRDKARQAVSYYLAARRNLWFVIEGEEPEEAGDERTDTERDEPHFQSVRWLEHALVQHEALWRTYFGDSAIEPLEVVYEDFSANYETTIRSVLDTIGITPDPQFSPQAPSLRKQADSRSEELLERYLEIRPSLAPHPDGHVWSKEEKRYVEGDSDGLEPDGFSGDPGPA
jgi:LPS sulfotransferase NodH